MVAHLNYADMKPGLSVEEVYQRFHINTLPFNPTLVTKQLSIALVTYQTLEAQGSRPQCSDDGFSFYFQGEPKIAYNTEGPSVRRQRFTLTHELCHHLLGHVDAQQGDKNRFEQQANALASDLLCPIAVLHLCGVTTAAEIMEICRVSLQAAKIALDRLEKARRFGDPTAGQEALVALMLPFISRYISQKTKRKKDSMRYRAVDIE